VLTFNNFLRKTDFVQLMGYILTKLEKSYGQPVDVEFTASVDPGERIHINILQCRPLFLPGSQVNILMPSNLDLQKILFRSQRMICGGVIEKIRYILYIDPLKYNQLNSVELKRTLGRIVGQINRHRLIVENKILMMGPGRWGSSNINLGVDVSYADIDNAEVLVELALEEAGQLPEVSYGTHFFQDLVEAQVIYLPVYPDDKSADFQKEFFINAKNILLDLFPKAEKYISILKLIDVPIASDGEFVKVVADPQHQKALCFLEK
jgi:pyruvate,water dikinase